VGALIEALKNKEDSLRLRVAEALKEITKEYFGQDYDKWTMWYKNHK
jgi:hypothetical protein